MLHIRASGCKAYLVAKLQAPPNVDGLIQEVLEFAQLEPVHSDRILRTVSFTWAKREEPSTWDDMRDGSRKSP